MALTDEDKLRVAVSAFCSKLQEIQTWDDFKSIVLNLTRAQIKNFLVNKLQAEAASRRVAANRDLGLADDYDGLAGEVNNL